MSISVSHIDTCLPCYLQDHHNREGELLLGVPVDGTTTYADVRDGLISEFNSVSDMLDHGKVNPPKCKDIRDAIMVAFEVANVHPDTVFDDGLEIPEDGEEQDGEGPQAWFVLSWDTEEAEDE